MMKEVIMKKIIFWLTMILGIVAVIGACKKSDDSTAATTSCAGATGGVEVSSCSATPSGSITGIDNSTLTGIISTQHVYGILGVNGVDNATDCIDNATSIAAFNAGSSGVPTGTNSMIFNQAITSSSTFADRTYFYSDSSCQTEIAHIIIGNSEFTVGDDVTGLSTSISGKSGTYPSTATKVTYKGSCFGMKGSTDAGVTWLKTFFGSMSINPTVGTSYSCRNDGELDSAFIFVDNSSTLSTTFGGTTIVYWDDAATTDWTSGVDTMTTLP